MLRLPFNRLGAKASISVDKVIGRIKSSSQHVGIRGREEFVHCVLHFPKVSYPPRQLVWDTKSNVGYLGGPFNGRVNGKCG